MITFGGIKALLWGSKTAKTVSIVVAAVVGIWGYGQVQYWRGGIGKETRIVEKSNKVARKKHSKVNNIRRNVKHGTARKRLQQYTRTDSN